MATCSLNFDSLNWVGTSDNTITPQKVNCLLGSIVNMWPKLRMKSGQSVVVPMLPNQKRLAKGGGGGESTIDQALKR